MWIRFWWKSNCISGAGSKEYEYVWFDKRPSNIVLKDQADDFVPDWAKHTERGYQFGFEKVSKLPEKVRLNLISRYERQINDAAMMLGVLKR